MSAPQPYPTRDPWEGTDEDDGGDVCHHGVGFDEWCGECDAETDEERRRARIRPRAGRS